MAPPPYVSFPWREHPQSDVHALIIVEMLNPHKQFAYKCEHLLGIHKCVGRVPADMTLDVKGQTYQTHAGETILSDAENSSGEVTDPSPIAPPARTSRRGFIMNSIVSSASLATVAAIAPSAALADTAVAISAARDDKEAVIARAQQIVEVLSNRFVCDGWHEHFDQQRAAEFLDAVRREDWSADDPSQCVITSWIRDHGQSLDWLYRGDPGGLICGTVLRSPVLATIPRDPDPIFAAIEAHRQANAAYLKAVDGPANILGNHKTARVCVGYTVAGEFKKISGEVFVPAGLKAATSYRFTRRVRHDELDAKRQERAALRVHSPRYRKKRPFSASG